MTDNTMKPVLTTLDYSDKDKAESQMRQVYRLDSICQTKQNCWLYFFLTHASVKGG